MGTFPKSNGYFPYFSHFTAKNSPNRGVLAAGNLLRALLGFSLVNQEKLLSIFAAL
jgi:hypothetical protein